MFKFESAALSTELIFLAIILALLVVPRILQRFRIPAPLTAFIFGIAGGLAFGNLKSDPTLGLLAALGISSLFLFAGLEIELDSFRKGSRQLFWHLLFRALGLLAFGWAGAWYFSVPWQVPTLLGIALFTPSTGFILDTLPQRGLNKDEQFWVASKAIAGEILALLLLFVVLQSTTAASLAISGFALAAMLIGLPFLFIVLGRYVMPYAPGSEFSLLVMVALIAAYITKQLGVYYLVGAFLVGLVARLLRERMPLLASDANLHAVRLFASFFVPFYFFHSGTKIPPEALSWQALGLGLAITALVLPSRIGFQWLQRRIIFQESRESSWRVSITLAPTLIFTLVLAGILRERYQIDDILYGALLVYAALTTILPSFIAIKQAVDFDPAHSSRAEQTGKVPPASAPVQEQKS